MSYVYRFLDTRGKVIYIGKTINIHNRMKQHFKGGHLPLECYKSVSRIEYQKYRTESDSLIMETYYITKYNPKYNQLQKSRDIPYIEFNEKKGLNCQARACAIFAYMLRMGCVDEYMVSMDEFAKVYDLVK